MKKIKIKNQWIKKKKKVRPLGGGQDIEQSSHQGD